MVEHRCSDTASFVRYVSVSQCMLQNAAMFREAPLHSNRINGQIQKPSDICMCRIRVILISWVGIDHPVYYFITFFIIITLNICTSVLSLYIQYNIRRDLIRTINTIKEILENAYFRLFSLILNIQSITSTLCIISNMRR